MADISKELDNFKNAKYGKDVRGSMVSLAEKLNKESSDTVKTVSGIWRCGGIKGAGGTGQTKCGECKAAGF